jgi:hypothetical protein
MRLIHPSALRVGKVDRWSSDQLNLNQSMALTADTIQTILQSYLGNTFNLFIVNCTLRGDVQTNAINVSAVFYKYIQRARLVKTRRMAFLIAIGAFKTKPPLYYVRLAQGFVVPFAVIIHLEALLNRAFNVTLRLKLYNITQIAEYPQSKASQHVMDSIADFTRRQEERLNMTDGARSWPPLESYVERNWLNPLAIRGAHQRYKSFNKLVYSVDSWLVILYASMYNLSNLLADLIVRGLLRNMKRHKQFLALVETTIEHFRSYNNWPFKPYDWCIAVNGKVGSGTIRSRSYYIKTGYLPLQTIMEPIDYVYRSAATKFGSVGVKIWMRKHA